MSSLQSGAMKSSFSVWLLPLVGVYNQLSGGGPGANKVSIWEEELDTELRRAMMNWNLIISTFIHVCNCRQ